MKSKNYNIVAGFNLIAPAYDLANDAMTLGLHRLWRRELVSLADKLTPKKGLILDVATGTGDVVLGILKRRGDVHITAIDPSDGMLKVARKKLETKCPVSTKQVRFEMQDARKLPYASHSFDTVTVCWGVRNIVPFAEGLKEILRVLKPGGSAIILESGTPEFKVVGKFYKMYSRLLPFIGGGISKYKPAYQYYAQSVDEFPCGKTFTAQLLENGFSHAAYRTLGGSIVYLYTGKKSKN